MKSINKRAQFWGTDLTVAFIIFALGIVTFYLYSFNYSNEAEDTLQILQSEGDIISEILLSTGSPENWDTSNVIQIGLTTNGKINQTKLEYFYELTSNNYENAKQELNTKYNFYFFVDEQFEVNSNYIDGIGEPNTNRTHINGNNIIKTTRFTIYKNKPTTATLYIFE